MTETSPSAVAGLVIAVVVGVAAHLIVASNIGEYRMRVLRASHCAQEFKPFKEDIEEINRIWGETLPESLCFIGGLDWPAWGYFTSTLTILLASFGGRRAIERISISEPIVMFILRICQLRRSNLMTLKSLASMGNGSSFTAVISDLQSTTFFSSQPILNGFAAVVTLIVDRRKGA